MTSSQLAIPVPVDEPVIVFERILAAPPELVFDLWTNPDHLRNWWGPREFEMIAMDIDLRVGGGYRFVQRAPDGTEYAFHGRYRELDPPGRLVYTTVYEGAPDSEAVERFTFEAVEGGTLIRCRSEHSS